MPTGEDKAQLLRVNAARCRRRRAMCSKRGMRGRLRGLPRYSHLVPTWHMFLEHPMISAPRSLSWMFRKEGGFSCQGSRRQPNGSWRPLPDTLPANGEISKTRVWRAAIVAGRRIRAHRVAVCSPSTHRSSFESQRIFEEQLERQILCQRYDPSKREPRSVARVLHEKDARVTFQQYICNKMQNTLSRINDMLSS